MSGRTDPEAGAGREPTTTQTHSGQTHTSSFDLAFDVRGPFCPENSGGRGHGSRTMNPPGGRDGGTWAGLGSWLRETSRSLFLTGPVKPVWLVSRVSDWREPSDTSQPGFNVTSPFFFFISLRSRRSKVAPLSPFFFITFLSLELGASQRSGDKREETWNAVWTDVPRGGGDGRRSPVTL